MRFKKYLLFLVIFAAILNIAVAVLPVLAQEAPPLEVEYPEVPAIETTPETTTTPLTKYVEYLFYFLVWGSGILALLALIYGGFKYITSFGNPDKLRDAKDRIISAILGLAIVLGSYVILWQINPQYLTFNLPPLKPFINTLAPGVWACKPMPLGPTYPLDVWVLEQIYLTERIPMSISEDVISSITRLTGQFAAQGLNLASISDENNMALRKAIKEKMDELLKYINETCYEIKTAEAIRDDFNDRIESLWFIPETIYGIHDGSLFVRSVNPYGAAVFDDDDFTGIGDIFFRHMFTLVRDPEVIYLSNRIKVSSIKPFKRYTDNAVVWRTRLYVEKNYNAGFLNTDPYQDILSVAPFGLYYADISPDGTTFIPKPILETEAGITIPPKSIKIDGEALAILYKDALNGYWDGLEQEWKYEIVPTTIGAGNNRQTGYYFQIFSDNDNNLEDDYNIVYWNRCPGYTASEAELEKCTVSIVAAPIGPGGGGASVRAKDCCAEADADAIMVLSNIRAY